MIHPDFTIRGESRLYVGCADALLADLLADRRTVLLTDRTVDALYRSFRPDLPRIVIEGGEAHKQLSTIEEIHRRLLSLGADRHSFVLALGGGIVTDVAGFAASTYMRGIRFGFVATTLLGQVDAAVGGKNGVNVGGYKNMAGTFTQPDFVVLDPAFLKTLPDREFRAGLAEVVKAAVIDDRRLFELLERADFAQLRNDEQLLSEAVRRAVGVKVRIVERDLHEAGDRRLLNLGHTLAHAIEKSSSAMNHGEAVAVGLRLIAAIAVKMQRLDRSLYERMIALLTAYGFNLQAPVSNERLLEEMMKDKKSVGEEIDLVLPLEIGHCRVERCLKSSLRALLSDV